MLMQILIFFIISILYSNDIIVSSFLQDSNNKPIEKANIKCDDNGTTSDNDGYFIIECSDNSTLTISHISYHHRSITMNSVKNIIYLEDRILISDIINIYGQFHENSKKVISTQVINNNSLTITNNFITDITSKISNFNYASGTSTPRYFQIRGLGELSQFSGEGPPSYYVSLIIDNIDFSGLSIPIALFDIEQIEIFKGSNSSLFGQNSLGGTINITSRNPSTEKTFSGSFSLENYNGSSLNFHYSNKLNDKFFYNTTISKYYTDGWIKNKQLIDGNYYYRYDSNSIDHESVKYKLLFVNDNLYVKTTFIYSHADNKYDVWSPDNNGFFTYTDFRGADDQRTNATSLYIKKSYPNINVVLISTYAHSNILYSYDSDWGNNEFWENEPYNFDNYYYDYFFPYNYMDSTERLRINKSNELRIILKKSKHYNIILGCSVNNIEEKDIRDGWLFAGNATNIHSNFYIKNTAIYSQLLLKNLNKLHLTLSLRNDENKTANDIVWTDYYDNSNILDYHISSRNLHAGNIKLEYKLSNRTSIISFFSVGYKPKGINQSPNTPEQYKIYNTETSYNYDVGIESISNNYSLNLSIFYIYRKNPQLRVFYQYDTNNPNSFDYATFNSKYGQNRGLEFDLKAYINNKLSISATLGYLNSYISKFIYYDNSYGDREQSHAPNYTYNVSFHYKILRNIIYKLSFNGMDSFYFDDQNQYTSSKRDLIDTSIHYKKNLFTITLWSKNILDIKYETRGYTFGLEPPLYETKNYQSYGAPRIIGITFSYSI